MTRLSATDALFLYADSSTAPMNMGSVQILKPSDDYDGDFLEDFRQFLADRLDHVPKLKMRLVSDGMGLPTWLPCEELDLNYHVRRTQVKSGEQKELQRKLGRLQRIELDPDRPLFMFYVIEGLDDGRIAILQKFHHALADGKTAVKMMRLFTDEGLEIFGDDPPERDDESPGWIRRVLSGGLEDVRRTATSLTGMLGVARRLIRPDGRSMLSRVVTRPVTIFNKPLSENRLFGMHEWPLDRHNAVRKALGLTFNEMGLTLLSGAVRRYLDERDALPDVSLICNVPVAIRAAGGETSGNAVLAMWVPLATDLDDRSERIAEIRSEVGQGKELLAEIQDVVQDGQGVRLPSFFIRSMGLSMGSGLVNRYMPPPGNIAMSSVPVPGADSTVLGAPVVALYGMPMILHGQAVSLTYSTYNDRVVMGALCCEEALPDPERLLAYMQDELDDMSAELGKATLREVGTKKRPAGKRRAKNEVSAAG